MSTTLRSPTRRELLAATAAAGAVSMFLGGQRAAASDDSIRPFTVNIPQEEVTELRRRIAVTRAGALRPHDGRPDQAHGQDADEQHDFVKLHAAEFTWREATA